VEIPSVPPLQVARQVFVKGAVVTPPTFSRLDRLKGNVVKLSSSQGYCLLPSVCRDIPLSPFIGAHGLRARGNTPEYAINCIILLYFFLNLMTLPEGAVLTTKLPPGASLQHGLTCVRSRVCPIEPVCDWSYRSLPPVFCAGSFIAYKFR